MANLVLFGDSFCAEYESTINKNTWWKQVAKQKNLDIKNYAIRGSSLNYSIVKYYEYLNTAYSPEDNIIFVVTSSARSPIVHKDFPPECAAILQMFHMQGFKFEQRNLPQSLIEHFTNHRGFYETWYRFYNLDQHLSQVSLVREALNGLSNKKLLINAFDEATSGQFSRKYDFHLAGDMNNISVSEFVTHFDYIRSRDRFVDDRANHFSEANHDIFTDYIIKSLDGNCISMLDIDFKRGFINA